MDTRRWFSRWVVLLDVLIIPALVVGSAWAQEPGGPDVLNGQEKLDELASSGTRMNGFLAIGVEREDVNYQDDGAVNVIYASDEALTADGNQFWYEGHDGMLGATEEDDRFGKTLAVGDFDGDGNLDLAIGVPHEDYNTISDAGIVHVLYGASGTLTTTGTTEVWHQNAGILDSVEAWDRFGSALAVGDFDGDGYQDLAIGVDGEGVGDDDDAGVVNVIYGSSSGLTSVGNQVWRQGANGVLDYAETGDQFGHSLASADFDGDGYDDLAVGVPYEDYKTATATIEDHGYVNVIYGSSSGLTGAGSQYFDQNRAGMINSIGEDDNFGLSLAGGDFDGDGYADLAIGVPYEDYSGGLDDAGAVSVVYGSAAGLVVDGNELLHQGWLDVVDTEANDRFGYSLTAGDFDGDGRDDLAVGVPYEGIGSSNSAGAVNVFYGATDGLEGSDNLTLTQDNPDISGISEANDYFGKALAAGHLNGDSYADLAIGVPGEDVNIFPSTFIDAGIVNVIYGSATGLTFDGDQSWRPPYIEGGCEDNDEFGSALAAYYEVRTSEIYLPLVLRD